MPHHKKIQRGNPNACNLRLRLNPKPTTVPVVVHNLRGSDSPLPMQAVLKVKRKGLYNPNTIRKYSSFSAGQLRFIDSAFLKLMVAKHPEVFQIQSSLSMTGKGDSYCWVWVYIPMCTSTPGSGLRSPFPRRRPSTVNCLSMRSDIGRGRGFTGVFGCCDLGDYSNLYYHTEVIFLADVSDLPRPAERHE